MMVISIQLNGASNDSLSTKVTVKDYLEYTAIITKMLSISYDRLRRTISL